MFTIFSISYKSKFTYYISSSSLSRHNRQDQKRQNSGLHSFHFEASFPFVWIILNSLSRNETQSYKNSLSCKENQTYDFSFAEKCSGLIKTIIFLLKVWIYLCTYQIVLLIKIIALLYRSKLSEFWRSKLD